LQNANAEKIEGTRGGLGERSTRSQGCAGKETAFGRCRGKNMGGQEIKNRELSCGVAGRTWVRGKKENSRVRVSCEVCFDPFLNNVRGRGVRGEKIKKRQWPKEGGPRTGGSKGSKEKKRGRSKITPAGWAWGPARTWGRDEGLRTR